MVDPGQRAHAFSPFWLRVRGLQKLQHKLASGTPASRAALPSEASPSAGRNKTQRVRAAYICLADFYACSGACANKVRRVLGTIRIVAYNARAGFYGYTDRKPTVEELRSITKAQKLKELGVEWKKRQNL